MRYGWYWIALTFSKPFRWSKGRRGADAQETWIVSRNNVSIVSALLISQAGAMKDVDRLLCRK